MSITSEFLSSIVLLFILLNPFLIIIYIIDLVQQCSISEFVKIITRAAGISIIVFVLFALTRNLIFDVIIQSDFASFQIFGGVIFLMIGIRFVFKGVSAIKELRGTPKHIIGSLTMPILIGPGTISASIVIGERLSTTLAIISILTAVTLSLTIMLGLKVLHDVISSRKEELIERYIEITGRITALVVGTFAVELIMRGVKSWIKLID
jgi:small neutral amino acid transporter SnatA (MarC family)